MASRHQYLKTVLALERASFSTLQSLPVENSSGENKAVTVSIPSISKARASDLEWFEKFERHYQQGKQQRLLTNLLAHGSVGDFTTTPYSDFDFTIVLSTEVLTNETRYGEYRRWLKALYRLLFRIDPLQHHGPFYLWDDLIKQYANSILPLAVYDDSWAMEQFDAEFHVCPEPSEQKSRLSLDLCNNLTNSKRLLFRLGYNRFAIKRYLSYVMLIPAFYYTDIGQPMKKADSFEPFVRDFGSIAKPIQIASEARQTWPSNPAWFKSIAPAFGGTRHLRRLWCLSLMDKKLKNTVRQIEPLIPALESTLKQRLCIE